MHNILTVLRKELTDAIRDKRALKLAFILPVFIILMSAVGMSFTVKTQTQDDSDSNGAETITTLPVEGAEYIPELIDWFKEHQIVIEDAPGDAYSAVQSQSLEYALVIPKKAEEQREQGKPIDAWLVYDASKQSVHSTLSKVRGVFYQWSGMQQTLSLLARGISPESTSPISWNESNVANEQKMGSFILASVPLMLMMCAVMGSLGLAADMTAGERERRSLESLLINPITSIKLMWGKWMAAVLLSLAVVIISLILMGVELYFIPFNELGLRVDVTFFAYVKIFVALIPVIFVVAGLQLSLGILARSFKDAQTYMSLLALLPMVPSMMLMTNPDLYAPWHLWVPILGQQTIIKDLLLGEAVPGIAFVAFWISSIPLTLASLWFAARQLRKSTTIYG